ncbi:MAG TPA: 4-alpha-glucanotransferase, partial [Candidatus Lustribacter sp.]|nr:4-alpha-glucanotransferase [Candidatus Lustribacter sp.]
MTSTPSDALTRLAQSYGVATDWWDWQGVHHIVSAEATRAVLAAFDVDASDDAAAWRALESRHAEDWRRMVPPVVVCREGWTPWVPVHLPHGDPVVAFLELESGQRWEVRQVDHLVEPRHVDGALVGEATFELPGNLPLGWHVLHTRSGVRAASATVVVTPARLELDPSLSSRRAWGLMSQVYAMRSARSWGVGDLADLAEIGSWAGAELGADFVLVNPLHAAEAVAPMEPSPYLPTSRRFVNPIYLRVEDI